MWNSKFYISGIWKLVWKLERVVSIITSSFLVYTFVDCSEAVSCLHLRQMFFPVNRSLPCVLQRVIILYMWEHIEGMVSEYWSSVSWSGRLTLGHLAQHRNRLVPAQDVHFFYTRSHLSALQNCALLFSTNFLFIFIFKRCTTKFSHWIV